MSMGTASLSDAQIAAFHRDGFVRLEAFAEAAVGQAMLARVVDHTPDNGCLQVVPGSHTQPVHDHVPDHRPGANYGYVEIVDHDMDDAVPVPMAPGDLLVFDSHLMHRSTDNVSDGLRAAMVFHLAAAGTTDHTVEHRGYTVNDWIPVRRAEGSP